MKDYYFFDFHTYSENTPEYGHGDYPDRIYYFLGCFKADTLRKAQNLVKKLHPELSLTFGGMFSPLYYEADELKEMRRHMDAVTDPRIGNRAKRTHEKGLSTLI